MNKCILINNCISEAVLYCRFVYCAVRVQFASLCYVVLVE